MISTDPNSALKTDIKYALWNVPRGFQRGFADLKYLTLTRIYCQMSFFFWLEKENGMRYRTDLNGS